MPGCLFINKSKDKLTKCDHDWNLWQIKVVSWLLRSCQSSLNHEPCALGYDYMWRDPKVKKIGQHKAVHRESQGPCSPFSSSLAPDGDIETYSLMKCDFGMLRFSEAPLNPWDWELQSVWKSRKWEELVFVVPGEGHCWKLGQWILGINRLSVNITSSGKKSFPNSFTSCSNNSF